MKDIIDLENLNKTPKTSKKKKFIMITIILIIMIVGIVYIVYSCHEPFRNFMDRYFFRKNVTSEKLASIQLDYDSNINVMAYNRHICVLAENSLKQYNSSGNIESELAVEVSNPIYDVSDKYLAISEKGSPKTYLISNSEIVWEKELDGNVSKIDVNNKGYVTAVITGTTHKSVIITFDEKGNELFKIYLARTTAQDACISPDNEYLSFAEINTSGTIIQSVIKVVSVEKAKENPSDSVVYKYKAPSNSLVTNIEYQGKNRLVCIYDDSIHVITNNEDEKIMDLEEDDKKIDIADINLNNYVYRAIEKSTGFFTADTSIEMMNTESKKEVVYAVEGVVKDIENYNDILAINLGQSVEFINTSGWLIKKYTSSQDIQKVIISNNIAGIIYADKVEIINL